MDLEEAGLEVELEKEIQLVYKGKTVGTRRADIVVKTASNEVADMELKAVRDVCPTHPKQLKYYMDNLQIDHGYLINYPHDNGFPAVDESSSVFDLKALQGLEDASTLDRKYLRLKNGPISMDVQVIEFKSRSV